MEYTPWNIHTALLGFVLLWLYHEFLFGDVILVVVTHNLHDYFTGTGAITWLPRYQKNNPEDYG